MVSCDRFLSDVQPSDQLAIDEVFQTADDLEAAITGAYDGVQHGSLLGRNTVLFADLMTTNVDYRMPNGQWSYPIDLTMAVSFMMLQASAEDLGSCVITTYDEQELKDILTVPYSMRVVLLLHIGSPADKPFPTQRKPLERIVSYNHW